MLRRNLSIILVIILSVLTFSACNEKKELDLTVMSYNILFAFPNDNYDPWTERKGYVSQIIKSHDPDLIGLQEPLPWQVYDLKKLCPEYASVNILLHTDSTILYKKDKFAPIEHGHYWLSPTPEKALSSGFGNFLPRYVIWAKFYHLDDGREFYFINTHFDNTSPFQETAAPLFLERTAPLAAELPVIIAGDFNSVIGSEAFNILTDENSDFFLKDAYQIAEKHDIYNCDNGGCDDSTHSGGEGQIDHIFVAGKNVSCSLWGVDKLIYGDLQRPPSDHFAVVAKIRLPAIKSE